MGKEEEYRKVNKPIYEGIDAFRTWLDGEIRELGPQSVAQENVNGLIDQNRKLRDRQDPDGSHTNWTNGMYLLEPSDDAAFTEEIEKREFEMCKGNVLKTSTGYRDIYTENWGLINISNWITEDTDQELIHWHNQYMVEPNRHRILQAIFNRKRELHELKCMRLQIQRLEQDNERLHPRAPRGRTLRLSELWKKVFEVPHSIFTAAKREEFKEICVKLHSKIELDKKYEFEKENEPIYSGVDSFRAHMEVEIGDLGPKTVRQERVNHLIKVNLGLRERLDPGGAHTSWSNYMYLIKPVDDANYQDDIDQKEMGLCRGNVYEKKDNTGATTVGHGENWGLIDIPDWISGDKRPADHATKPGLDRIKDGPEIDEREIEIFLEELRKLTSDANAAWDNIVKLSTDIVEVEAKRNKMMIWHNQYMVSPQRDKNLADIWDKKREWHDLLRLNLQIQRLKEDNKRLTQENVTGTRTVLEDDDEDGLVGVGVLDPAEIGPKPPNPVLKAENKLPQDLKFCPVALAQGESITMARVKLAGEDIDASEHGLWFDKDKLVNILRIVQKKHGTALDGLKKFLRGQGALDKLMEEVASRIAKVKARDAVHKQLQEKAALNQFGPEYNGLQDKYNRLNEELNKSVDITPRWLL